MNKIQKERLDGVELENQTSNLLRLFPGSEVSTQVELVGKRVDVVCVLPGHLAPSFRIAVECKDWNRPLTRHDCSLIVSEYVPLLEHKAIDQFLLVTRDGIVASAKKLFDGKRTQHLCFAELADKVFDPRPLVANSIRQYSKDGLDRFYIRQRAFAPNLGTVAKHYDLIYNDFIDYAIEMGKRHLHEARAEWESYATEELQNIARPYNYALFSHCFDARKPTRPVDLEDFALDWIRRDDISLGLALLGTYGTGKSSFARRLAYVCGEMYQENTLARIPLLIELKEFGSHQDVRGLITHELVNRHGIANGSFELFQSLNASGRFVIILDGFDEMKQGMTADSLLFNFNQLGVLCTPNSKVVLCGRPTVFESQAEQDRILKGQTSLAASHQAKYIQVTIAPFGKDDVLDFLTRYSAVKFPEDLLRIKKFAYELHKEVSSGEEPELESIVSRPVHLPMLAAVIPRTHMEPSKIRRSALYDEFINAIIEREMLKRRREFQQSYDTQSRKRFARDLAVEMCRQGESRSITTSEIPGHLFDEFLRPGYPVEAVRRDLVTACFLERKPPSILFFPHKSFLEFLAADYLVEFITREDVPVLADIRFEISEEIFSFMAEMLPSAEWVKLSDLSESNLPIIRMWLDFLTRSQGHVPDLVEEQWVDTIQSFPSKLKEYLVRFYEAREKHRVVEETRRAKAKERRASSEQAKARPLPAAREKDLSVAATAILNFCLSDSTDVIAAHAFFALSNSARRPTENRLLTALGESRLLKWNSFGWINIEGDLETRLRRRALAKLVGVIAYCSDTREHNQVLNADK